MDLLCGNCKKGLYSSSHKEIYNNANLCQCCRNVVCDQCFIINGSICLPCHNDIPTSCNKFDCLANIFGKCAAGHCRGFIGPNDQNDLNCKNFLTLVEHSSIYNSLIEILLEQDEISDSSDISDIFTYSFSNFTDVEYDASNYEMINSSYTDFMIYKHSIQDFDESDLEDDTIDSDYEDDTIDSDYEDDMIEYDDDEDDMIEYDEDYDDDENDDEIYNDKYL